MPEPISFGKLEFRLEAGSSGTLGVPDPETPFRIAVLGDFSGRSASSSGSTAFPTRPVLVDRDNFEEVFQKLKVELPLNLESLGQPGLLRFQSLEDFHPDSLFAQAPVFESLREIRRRLNHPSTFAEAAAEVKRWASSPTEAGRPSQTAAQPEENQETSDLSAGFLIEGLKERSQTDVNAGNWNDQLREIVRPHLAPREDPQQGELVSSVDAAISSLMREILHHPAFQSLEAAWRGVFFLISQLETGSVLKLYLFDISKSALTQDLRSVQDLSRTQLYRLLVEQSVQTPGADPWALLAGNYTFDLENTDLEILGRLAKVACAAGAPLVAAAAASMVGCQSLADTPDPDDWGMSRDTEVVQAWEALRRLPEASSLGLLLPRFLLRPPYGRKSDPIESFAFEETAGTPQHEEYLWGNPCFVAAYLLGRTFSESGWDFTEGTLRDVERLPLYMFEENGESVVKPCAEILLTERAAEIILNQGLMPLLSMKGEDHVRLLRFQSVADPSTLLAGRWS